MNLSPPPTPESMSTAGSQQSSLSDDHMQPDNVSDNEAHQTEIQAVTDDPEVQQTDYWRNVCSYTGLPTQSFLDSLIAQQRTVLHAGLQRIAGYYMSRDAAGSLLLFNLASDSTARQSLLSASFEDADPRTSAAETVLARRSMVGVLFDRNSRQLDMIRNTIASGGSLPEGFMLRSPDDLLSGLPARVEAYLTAPSIPKELETREIALAPFGESGISASTALLDDFHTCVHQVQLSNNTGDIMKEKGPEEGVKLLDQMAETVEKRWERVMGAARGVKMDGCMFKLAPGGKGFGDNGVNSVLEEA